MPGISVDPCCKVKVAVLIVVGSITSLKAAMTYVLVATPVSLIKGATKVTVGRWSEWV